MHTDDEREYLDACRVRCGMPRLGFPQPHLPRKSAFQYDALAASEWSAEFEHLMRNRLIMGALRYGLLGDPRKPNWDRMGRLALECDAYLIDHNQERLVDMANMCLLEFVDGVGHFEAKDDTGIHTARTQAILDAQNTHNKQARG